MSNVQKLLGARQPFGVPAHIGQVRLIVTDSLAKATTAVGAYMHHSPAPRGLRFAGGCAGMSPQDKIDMLEYFRIALRDFTGLVSSGATRSEANGSIDPMVTDVPAMLAKQRGNRVLTVSTVPRTGTMGLVGDSRLVLDLENSVNPQPGVHLVVVFQHTMAHQTLGWDGDVDGYLNLFDAFVQNAGWRFGLPVWNGGSVTQQEAQKAARRGWPVFLIQGSGRAADDLANAFRENRLSGPFVLVDRSDPESLRTALLRHRLVQ